MGNHKLKWTEEEEEALLAGVQKHGPGKWKNIIKDPEFADSLYNRSNIDLKDKWRNLNVPPDIQGSIDKVRTPKIKAAALNLAAVAAAATSTPPPSSATPSPVAPLPRSGSSDLNVDDSWNTMVDAKNAPRYDGMIFEALSALTDPNGSDVTTIFNFIEEKKHEVPPGFKRVLGSRLRRLAAQGKIEKVNQIRAGTQNFYRMNGTSFSGVRTPVVARPKEVNVKPRQTNSQRVLTVSQKEVDQASGTAAFKFAEVEKNLELVKRAAEHKERMIKLAEQAEIILLLAEELHEACCQGNIVELN
ncbi:telomere repeat-binding factor 4 [Brassica rapa]|uniref:telomere repeat-binding factor 4 n=1 Tax=Brassica campestris TaxID=3711 RepID=UPI0004F14BF1|nr:telomere repeat-binding factor 4 [Brassica rapa]